MKKDGKLADISMISILDNDGEIITDSNQSLDESTRMNSLNESQ